MLRFLPRALVATTVVVSASACTPPADTADAGGGSQSGRYRVLVPALPTGSGVAGDVGNDVADDLRSMISDMATHTAVSGREIRSAMRQNNVAQLDEVTARQLAQAINAEMVAWGTIQQNGGGLEGDLTFTDVRSGDQFLVEDVTGQNADQLAQAIFQSFEQKIQGIRQAAFCNDYLSSQQFEQALQTCEQALAIVPTSTAALYGKATALVNLDRDQEALDIYRQVLELDPDHGDALLGAGLAASELGESQEAIGYYTRYMEMNPGDVTVRMKVAGDVAQTGDYVSAAEILRAADTQENAANIDFQRYLFQVTTAAGQRAEEETEGAGREYFETGLQAYERVMAAQPDSMDVASIRQAIALNTGLGRTQEAIQLAQQATQQFPDDAGVWDVYARVLKQADQDAEAARALTRVIELDPEMEDVYIRRALAYMDAGNRQSALADLQTAAGRGNQDDVARAIYSMAGGLLRNSQWSEAEGLLEMANQYASGEMKDQIQFFLGLTQFRQGEAIAKANTQGNPGQAERALGFFQQALNYLQATNYQNAAEVLDATQQYIANQQAIIEAARGR